MTLYNYVYLLFPRCLVSCTYVAPTTQPCEKLAIKVSSCNAAAFDLTYTPPSGRCRSFRGRHWIPQIWTSVTITSLFFWTHSLNSTANESSRPPIAMFQPLKWLRQYRTWTRGPIKLETQLIKSQLSFSFHSVQAKITKVHVFHINTFLQLCEKQLKVKEPTAIKDWLTPRVQIISILKAPLMDFLYTFPSSVIYCQEKWQAAFS